MRHVLEFWRDDSGAVTIEWVALAAGAVLLALLVVDQIAPVLNATSVSIAQGVQTAAANMMAE